MSMRNVHSLKVAVQPANTMFSALVAIAFALLAPACTSDGGPGDGSGSGSGSGFGDGSCDTHALQDGVWTVSSHGENARMYGSSSTPATELSFRDGWGSGTELNVRLYSGTADFPSNPMVAPSGTIDLANDDDIATCGACVYFALGTNSGSAGVKYYFATSGSLTITSVTPMFDALLKDVILTHVDVDAAGVMTPSADGCEYTLSSGQIYVGVIGAGAPPEPRTLNTTNF